MHIHTNVVTCINTCIMHACMIHLYVNYKSNGWIFSNFVTAYVTNKICLFESGDLCGWEEVTLQEGGGESGVIKASEANFPLPSVDVSPGNSNGML